MRLTTSHYRQRPPRRAESPAPEPRGGLLAAIGGLLSRGRRRKAAALAREQFEQLDIDQRVRRIGEW